MISDTCICWGVIENIYTINWLAEFVINNIWDSIEGKWAESL